MSARQWYRTGDLREAWREFDVDTSLVERVASDAAERVRWDVAVILDRIASPIERKLLLAFIATHGSGSFFVSPPRVVVINGESFGFPGDSEHELITIECQKQVGRYRADFLVSWVMRGPWGDSTGVVAVEADGHDFHEKTKQQAAHDKKRDRFFVAQGFSVLRFAGSEIHRAAESCAVEALRVAWDKASEGARAKFELGMARSK